MPYLDVSTKFNATRKVYKTKAGGGTPTDQALLKATREIKALDPYFMPSIKPQTRKLSPQKKGALLRQLAQKRESLTKATQGKDIFQVPKKKGETKLSYTRRVRKIQRANNQGDQRGLFVTVQNQETASGKRPKLEFSKNGRIITKYNDGEYEARAEFVPATLEDSEEGGERTNPLALAGDIREAIEIGRSWKVPPDQVAVSIFGTRLSADTGLVWTWQEIVGEKYKAPKKSGALGIVDENRIEGFLDGAVDKFFEDFYPDMNQKMDELMKEEGQLNPALKSYAKKRAEGYDGIWVEFSGVIGA